MTDPGAGPAGRTGWTGEADEITVADRYRLHERVGAGGMGVVYRATDVRLKRQVALKRVLLPAPDDDGAAEIRRRTLREAEIAAQVHHPRIVSVFDVLDDAGGPLLVLEYLPSRSLGALVADVGVLTPGVAARIGAQVAEALAAAHAAGIVHRDVKPGNVLVSPGGSGGAAGESDPVGPVKLTDFGISQLAGTGTLTASGIGTPAYFAPEVARGERPSAASDVYALGATLYTVVQGAPPYGWSGDNPLALIRRIAQEPVPRPAVGGPLGALLSRLVAEDPDARPGAADAAEQLWRIADRREAAPPTAPGGLGAPTGPRHTGPDRGGTGTDGTGPHPDDVTTDEPTTRAWYRRRTVLAGAGLVLAAAVAAGAIVATRGAGDAPVPAVASGAFPAAVPALTVGDQRTADPCSPARPEALTGFGATRLIPDYGGFASCLVEIAQSGSDTIDVSYRFNPPGSGPPEGQVQRLGDALVGRTPVDGDSCERVLSLADGTPLVIDATFAGKQSPLADVCTVAEAAAGSAATTLATTGIGRREPPSTGLWTTDACTLLTPDDLEFLPQANRTEPFRGFGSWKCDWDDGRDAGIQITVSYDRYSPPDQAGGRAVPGTPAFVRADEPGRCNGEVPKRPFLGSGGKPQVEELRVLVEGPGTPQQLCDRAGLLAAAADART